MHVCMCLFLYVCMHMWECVSVCVPFISLSIYIYMSVIFMPTDVRCKYPDTYLLTPFWMTTIFTLNIVIFVVFVSTCIGKTLFCTVHLIGNFLFFSFWSGYKFCSGLSVYLFFHMLLHCYKFCSGLSVYLFVHLLLHYFFMSLPCWLCLSEFVWLTMCGLAWKTLDFLFILECVKLLIG